MGVGLRKCLSKTEEYAFCRCCQSPGCCCCWKCCKYNKVMGFFVGMANKPFCPCCLCCTLPIEQTVFLAGMSGSGKTALLYYFVLNKFFQPIDNTKGFNNELCTFNLWQTYEFWDPGGTAIQRVLWKKYYSRIQIDHVVYLIDARSWKNKEDLKKKDVLLDDDRMELHTLLNEEELRDTKFTVFANFFKEDEDAVVDQRQVREIEEDLDLSSYTALNSDRIAVVGTVRQVKERLGVKMELAQKDCC